MTPVLTAWKRLDNLKTCSVGELVSQSTLTSDALRTGERSKWRDSLFTKSRSHLNQARAGKFTVVEKLLEALGGLA